MSPTPTCVPPITNSASPTAALSGKGDLIRHSQRIADVFWRALVADACATLLALEGSQMRRPPEALVPGHYSSSIFHAPSEVLQRVSPLASVVAVALYVGACPRVGAEEELAAARLVVHAVPLG